MSETNAAHELEPERRVVWVIEFKDTSQAPAPRYWGGLGDGWTWEIDKAIQFAREIDCTNFMVGGFYSGLGHAREHVILSARRTAAAAGEIEAFQARVQPWLMACFGPEISADKVERNHRFLEEALELVQATGCTQDEAHQLVDYVYGRDQGDINQEVGGVMVTLAALCLASGFDMHAAGETELARIWTKVEQIRAKQAAKPKHSPLPAALSPSPSKTGEATGESTRPAIIDEIAAGLEGVTEGPWRSEAGSEGARGILAPQKPDGSSMVIADVYSWPEVVADNAAHIARLSPENVRIILAYIANLERTSKTGEKANTSDEGGGGEVTEADLAKAFEIMVDHVDKLDAPWAVALAHDIARTFVAIRQGAPLDSGFAGGVEAAAMLDTFDTLTHDHVGALINAYQWVRNIQDGTSVAADALKNMEEVQEKLIWRWEALKQPKFDMVAKLRALVPTPGRTG